MDLKFLGCCLGLYFREMLVAGYFFSRILLDVLICYLIVRLSFWFLYNCLFGHLIVGLDCWFCHVFGELLGLILGIVGVFGGIVGAYCW